MIGIGSMNGMGGSSWFPNLAQMNDLKLTAALSKKGTSIEGISSVGNSTTSSSLSNDKAKFLKEYQGEMADLLTSAQALRIDQAESKINAFSVESSDNTKVTARAKYRLTEAANYTVDVRQLATAQTQSSQGLDTQAPSTLSGELSIAVAGRENPLRIDIASITGETNGEKLQGVADAVNHLKAGVTAQVTQKDGKSVLTLTGDKTGKSNAFNVSGSFAQDIGLDRIEQAATDAIYTVDLNDGKAPEMFSSNSNTVQIGSYRLEATLKGTGEAKLNVGRDTKTMAGAVGDLVDNFNSTLRMLNDNADRGPGVLRQMKRMLQMPLSDTTLSTIGIGVKKDGTLSFDQVAFQKAMDKDPQRVTDLISGSYGLANGIMMDARAGMNASSNSLIGQNPAGDRYSGASAMEFINSAQKDPLNMMSMYSRSGVYNLTNYNAVGMLMNMSV